MVDQNSIFGGMLTTLGAAKKTNCDALGTPWEPKYMLIGDANGTDPVPSPEQTQLINQRYRAQLNQLRVSPTDENILIAELVLPPDVGGWWIREAALEDKDGVFSAVANIAPSYKPLLTQGSGRNQVVRMHIITSGTSNIQLKIDPSVVLATREFVDTRIQEELCKLDNKQSVRAASTANIALTGLQVLDGVALVAGDRVLVKNQTAGKDNGIYVVAATAWKRSSDADTSGEVTSALQVSVEQGTTLADSRWQLITDGAIVLGTTALTFQNVNNGLAPLRSPVFVDNPTGPTPPQFDSGKSLATTEFVKVSGIQFGSISTLSAAGAIPRTALGGECVLQGVGNYSVTLPSTSAALSPATYGQTLTLLNITSNPITVLAFAGENITAGANSQPSIVLLPGDRAILSLASQNYWHLIGGEASLKYSGTFANSLGGGWQVLPGGLIEVRGAFTSPETAGSATAVTFPYAFPNGISVIFVSVASATNNIITAWSSNPSRTGFNGRCSQPSSSCYYIAKGW